MAFPGRSTPFRNRSGAFSEAMVEIQFLGALAVHELEPSALQSVLNRPRLVALLAYLAVRPGFRRRDTLIGLLWPESAQAVARARLRKSLFQLRQAFGNEAVLNRGAEEVALATSLLHSDVGRFERALAEGRAEEALAVYAGDLLPGFFLPDAPAWEGWLEDERHRLRQLALSAALGLARECEGAKRADEAVRWAREACRVSPEDETAASQWGRSGTSTASPAGWSANWTSSRQRSFATSPRASATR